MSEYLGLLSVNINLERCVSFSDRYRSSSDSFMGKSYSDFREMDEICFFSRARSFSPFFSPFLLFLTPCFQIRAFHHNYVLFKGDWNTLQRRGSTEPNSLRYGPSKLAPKTFVCIRLPLYMYSWYSMMSGYSCNTYRSSTGMVGYRWKFWGLTLKGRISTSLAPLTLSVGG